MKKEAGGKKGKVLWIVLGIVLALAIVAGVILALTLGGEDTSVGGRPDLYWNIDREENVDKTTGLSTRKPAEDGNYYVRFAHDGEQIELAVDDKKLVNYIDGLALSHLVFDKSGTVIDVFPPQAVASVVGEALYVERVEGDTLYANSSVAMNGRKITVKLNDDTTIYNVSGKGEFVGEPLKAEDLNTMDTIGVYGTFVPEDSEEETVVTHIFVTNKPVESPVYWRADQFYDSSNKVTTREPDENGAYTIKWFVDGQTVELKCKNQTLVSEIDSADYHWPHWGLEFDEDSYIIATVNSALASRTLLQCERFDITELYDDGSYVATSLIKNNGSFVQGKVGPDCKIYDVSKAARAEGRVNERVDSLKMGDRVCIWTDTQGNPVLIYITNRIVESDIYWVGTRMYSSATKTSTREPNANGLYEIPMLRVGDKQDTIYYARDLETCTAIDSNTDNCVGLKLSEGNMIEAVYDTEALFGNTRFTNGYFVIDVTGSVGTYLSHAGSGFSMNGVMAAGCKVINVSDVGEYGAEWTLQIGDQVAAYKTPNGELAHIFITKRPTGAASMYYRFSARAYDSAKQVTTREPDADGYYAYEFTNRGKTVTLKTKDKAIATEIDARSRSDFGLEVKNGIILDVYDHLYPLGGQANTGYFIKEITKDKLVIYNNSGNEYEEILSDNFEAYNVSSHVEEYKGEKITPKVGDYVTVYRDIYYEVAYMYVTARGGNKVAWPVLPQYDSATSGTARKPDADGWYYVDLVVDGKVSTYKTKNKKVMDSVDNYAAAFGIRVSGNVIQNVTSTSYVEGIYGTGVTDYTVASVSGSTVKVIYTLGHATNTGVTQELTLNTGVKIYDVSDPTASDFGKATKLKVGDVIRSYTYQKDRTLTEYVFVTSHCTREGGYKSYCDHCDKVVYWNPYTAVGNAARYDTHYYLASDVEQINQMWAYGNTQENLQLVLDLNGHTLTGNGCRAAYVRYGATLTIFDSVGGGSVTSVNNEAIGSVILIDGPTADYPTSTVNFYSGTITKQENDTKHSARGSLVGSSGIFNMYGGELVNGYVCHATGGTTSGGAVYANGGEFNMYGGKISNCVGVSGYSEKPVLNPDGTPVIDEVTGQPKTEKTYATTYGGSFHILGDSTVVNIYDGVIEGGKAGRGGNFYIQGGTLNVYGGVIKDGIATSECGPSGGRGGNMFITGTGIVNLMGGTVSDGDATTMGGNLMNSSFTSQLNISGDAVITGGTSNGGNSHNIALMYANLNVSGGSILIGDGPNNASISTSGTASGGYSTVNISGGKIEGNIVLGGGMGKDTDAYPDYRTVATISGGEMDFVDASLVQKITIAGKPVIKNLQPAAGLLLDVGEMTDGANVTINTAGVFTKPVDKAADYIGYFHCADSGFETSVTAENELKFSNPNATGAYCEHCDTEADWLPWDGVSVVTGHYYLTDNVQLTSELVVNADVTYDLRGFTITAAPDSRVFNVKGGGILNVIDTSANETGVITGGKLEGRGGNIYVDSACAFNLYSGTITGGETMGVVTATNARGGNIFGYGDVTLYGGTVSNGKSLTGNGSGGNIMMTGATLTVHEGATIIGGQGLGDNNVALMYATLKLMGGSILNGDTTTGVSISASGTSARGGSTINISSGVIDGVVYTKTGAASAAPVDYRTTAIISGGELADLQLLDAHAGLVTLSGAPVIDSLTLGSGIVLDVAGLTDGASVKVNATSGVFTDTLANANDVVGYFDALADGYNVVVNANNKLEVTVGSTPAGDYCEHCQADVDWQSWNGVAFEESGHYRMTADVQSTGEITIPAGMEITLDLNGYSLTAKEGARNFTVTGTLIVQDSTGADTGKIIGSTVSGIHGGNINVNKGTFHLYSGTVTGGAVETSGYYGGNIVVQGSTGNAQIHGGVISNGSAQRGGNIYIGNTVVNISGDAQILGGTTTYADTSGRGGNIYITSPNSSLVVSENAVIANGNAGTGGNIYSMYGNVTIMDNAQVKNGYAVLGDGNINVGGTQNAGSLTITGGTISDGEILISSGSNPNIITISGGNITSPVRVNNGTTLNISGAPVIADMTTTVPVNVGTMTENASVKINATSGAFTDVLTNANDVVGYFDTVAVDRMVVVNSENKLEIVEACPCGCKTLLSEVVWEDAATYLDPSKATWHYNQSTSVHLRLTDDLDLDEHFGKSCQITIGYTAAAEVAIDLNGYTLSSTNRLVAAKNSTLTILDSSADKDGMILCTSDTGNTGGVVGVDGGTLNLLSGTLAMADESQGLFKKGGIVYISGTPGGTFNMYGGAILNGKALETSGDAAGGNVCVFNGTFNMYDGLISGGSAGTRGGNVCVYSGGTFNMHGGEITDGTATQGADIYVANSTSTPGIANIYGGKVAGEIYVPNNNAKLNVSGVVNLGNVNLQSTAVLGVGNLANGTQIKLARAGVFTDVLADAERYVTFFSGVADGMVAEATADGKLTLVSSNACPCGCGADKDMVVWEDMATYLDPTKATWHFNQSTNVHLRLNADLDLDEHFNKTCQVTIGYTAASSVTIDLNGYTLSSTNRFMVAKDSTLTILDSSAEKNGKILCTNDTGNSGGVVGVEGTLNLLSGTLAMKDDAQGMYKKGGVVYISGTPGGTFNMYGGAIRNGKALDTSGDAAGGNVCVFCGTFNLYDGTIAGGQAGIGANVCIYSSGTFNQFGGTVEDANNTVENK